MRFLVDFGSPLFEPPQSVNNYANALSEDLECAYRIAREVTGMQHRREENRYNERVVSRQYAPGALMRVIQRTTPTGVPSKLAPRYSGLCKLLEVRGPVLKLRELDSQREFTANHDAVRLSTLSPIRDPLADQHVNLQRKRLAQQIHSPEATDATLQSSRAGYQRTLDVDAPVDKSHLDAVRKAKKPSFKFQTMLRTPLRVRVHVHYRVILNIQTPQLLVCHHKILSLSRRYRIFVQFSTPKLCPNFLLAITIFQI